MQQIIEQAFLIEASIFHREEEFYGLGHFPTFTETIFGNYAFVNSNFRPLEAWSHYQDDYLKPKVLQKYSTALLTAVSAYFDSKDFFNHPSAISVGVGNLSMSATFCVRKLKNLPGDQVYYSENYKALFEISETLKALLELTQKKESEIPDYTFNEKGYDRHRDPSFYGILAYGIYDFFEKLSMDREHDEAIRSIAIHLWLEIVPIPDSSRTKTVKEIQKRLSFHFCKKIDENLEKLYYPMLTRLLINLIGLYKTVEECNEIEKEVLNRIKKKFKFAYDKDEDKIKDILPEGIRYQKETNELIKEIKKRGIVQIFKFKLE